MSYTVKDHGFWRPYTPNPVPLWAQMASYVGGAVVFYKRDGDGMDYYDFLKSAPFGENAVIISTTSGSDPNTELVFTVFRDPSMVQPYNQRVIEVLGVDPAETKPHNLFEFMKYHPDTLTFSGDNTPPVPPVLAQNVTAAQALIQLSRMPHDGSVVPGAKNLADATEALVAQSGDYELKTWFNRAQRWFIDNPNVLKIGAAFSLSAADIKAAFDAAALIAN